MYAMSHSNANLRLGFFGARQFFIECKFHSTITTGLYDYLQSDYN